MFAEAITTEKRLPGDIHDVKNKRESQQLTIWKKKDPSYVKGW
jgi:hypothetical protein